MTYQDIQAAIAALNLPASVRVISPARQFKDFRADYTTKDGPETIVARVRWDDHCSNGHNSFAVTATVYGTHRYPGEETIEHKSGRKLWAYKGGCCQHKRRAKRLPTIDTRNEMGALIAAAPELLAVAVELQEWAEKMGGWEAPCWDRLRAAIAKATQTP